MTDDLVDPQLNPELQPIIDKLYVLFTTQYATHLTTGFKLDAELKSRVLTINAEPVRENTRVVHTLSGQLLDVHLWTVIVRDDTDKKHSKLYRVVYDPQYVLECDTPVERIRQLQAQVTLKSNYYDPITRT